MSSTEAYTKRFEIQRGGSRNLRLDCYEKVATEAAQAASQSCSPPGKTSPTAHFTPHLHKHLYNEGILPGN